MRHFALAALALALLATGCLTETGEEETGVISDELALTQPAMFEITLRIYNEQQAAKALRELAASPAPAFTTWTDYKIYRDFVTEMTTRADRLDAMASELSRTSKLAGVDTERLANDSAKAADAERLAMEHYAAMVDVFAKILAAYKEISYHVF